MSIHTIHPDACITCSTCVAHCPVAAATAEFLGPRLIGPAQERFRLLGLEEEKSLHYCANCKNCDIVCPHNVPISTFTMMARAEYAKKHTPSLRDWMLGHGALIAKWLSIVPACLRNFGMNNRVSREILHVLGVHKHASLPIFARRTFTQLFKKIKQEHGRHGPVIFFPGCYVDIYDPQTGLDMVWALNKAGYTVVVPENMSCCGLPMVANGFWEHARESALRNAKILHGFKKDGMPVLTGCPSCTLMFSGDLPVYFPEISERYGDISLTDMQEFLLHCVHDDKLILPNKAQHENIIYHAPCHLRAQGKGAFGFELLQALYGSAVQGANAGCCGVSGSYGFKREKYDIAMQVGSELFQTIKDAHVQEVSSECGTCRVQITHGTGKPCIHPISLVRRAYNSAQSSYS